MKTGSFHTPAAAVNARNIRPRRLIHSLLARACWIGAVGVVALCVLASSAAAWQNAQQPYEVRFEGVEGALLNRLRGLSDAVELQERPPATIALLRRRGEEDAPAFIQALRAEGYFAAEVDVRIDDTVSPPILTFVIEPGPPFRFGERSVRLAEGVEPPAFDLPEPAALGLREGERAYTQTVLEAERRLLTRFELRGHPFAEVADREVIADHATNRLDVHFKVDPGPSAVFGPVEFEGLEQVREDFARLQIPWEVGDRFNAARLSEAREKLTETNLFSMARVEPGEQLDAEGRLPVSVYLSERRHRTVRAGVSFRTDEGVGGRVAWEHRNLLRRGERLTISARGSGITKALEVDFEKPAFAHPEQTLRSQTRVARATPDAFTSTGVSTRLSLERDLTDRLTVGGGVEATVSEIEQLRLTRQHAITSLPMFLDWDRRNDALNPTAGGRINWRLAPFRDWRGSAHSFVRSSVSLTQYYQVIDNSSLVLAGRLALGTVAGADREDVPADERFYAGGGGSIRGFRYQSVGPLVDDTPTGGSSLLEMSLEARYRMSDNVGFVVFADGGNAFERETPDFSETLRWGSGVGLRYYTPMGPLRFDVAVPVNGRSGIDDPFQLYISIGHSF
ncbi:MAG: autotransporter assembly complex family protein [Candidatus Hydrogenedentota bacterium]